MDTAPWHGHGVGGGGGGGGGERGVHVPPRPPLEPPIMAYALLPILTKLRHCAVDGVAKLQPGQHFDLSDHSSLTFPSGYTCVPRMVVILTSC